MREVELTNFHKFKIRPLIIAAALSILSSLAHAEIFFIHNDHRGAPIAMTDKSGAVIWKATYEPFGKATVTKIPSAAAPHPPDLNLRLLGQYFDAETGLNYTTTAITTQAPGVTCNPIPLGLLAALILMRTRAIIRSDSLTRLGC